MDFGAVIRRSGADFSANVAVWFAGREQTYAEMYGRAVRLANAFRAVGAKRGDRVAVLSDNAFETVEQAAACALGNFPRATLYTYHSPAINRYLLELVGATVFVVQARYYGEIAPLLGDLPDLKAVFVFDGPAPDPALRYEDAIAAASDEDRPVPASEDDVHIIRFSSGTTGKPKGIFHTAGRWRSWNSEYRWVTPQIDETSRYLVPCALAHLGAGLMWGFIMVGGRLMPMAEFDARRTLELMEAHRVTHTAAVPTMVRSILDDPTCRSRDLSALRCLMYAGSPIASGTLRDAIEVFGPTLFQLYAQSEVAPITMLLPHQHNVDGSERDARRLRSVGRSTPNSFVTIRDETGDVMSAGTIGEIACASATTMSGLWNDSEGTASRFLPDGSVLTRDMGYMDEDGFVYLVDRKDDMIISGGYNIWPSELEQVLSQHAAVAEVSVFGVPHERWGETPKAVVVLKPGFAVTSEDLIAFTRGVVGGVKKVTSVEFARSLPRTASGKVMRSALKAPFWDDRASRISGS